MGNVIGAGCYESILECLGCERRAAPEGTMLCLPDGMQLVWFRGLTGGKYGERITRHRIFTGLPETSIDLMR